MLNPFIECSPAILEVFRLRGKRFLVSQTYRRGVHELDGLLEAHRRKQGILLTQYDDRGLAKDHLKALEGDPMVALLDLDNEKHLNRLQQLMLPDSTTRLYVALVRDPKDLMTRVSKVYTRQIRAYIAEHTDWIIGADKRIKPELEVIFGELHVILKYSTQVLRVPFYDIENQSLIPSEHVLRRIVHHEN